MSVPLFRSQQNKFLTALEKGKFMPEKIMKDLKIHKSPAKLHKILHFEQRPNPSSRLFVSDSKSEISGNADMYWEIRFVHLGRKLGEQAYGIKYRNGVSCKPGAKSLSVVKPSSDSSGWRVVDAPGIGKWERTSLPMPALRKPKGPPAVFVGSKSLADKFHKLSSAQLKANKSEIVENMRKTGVHPKLSEILINKRLAGEKLVNKIKSDWKAHSHLISKDMMQISQAAIRESIKKANDKLHKAETKLDDAIIENMNTQQDAKIRLQDELEAKVEEISINHKNDADEEKK